MRNQDLNGMWAWAKDEKKIQKKGNFGLGFVRAGLEWSSRDHGPNAGPDEHTEKDMQFCPILAFLTPDSGYFCSHTQHRWR